MDLSINTIISTAIGITTFLSKAINEHGSSSILNAKISLLNEYIALLKVKIDHLISISNQHIIYNTNRVQLKGAEGISKIVKNLAVEYIQEIRSNSNAIIFISGIGLDYFDFKEHLREYLDYDCFALSLFGFEPSVPKYPEISFEEHIIITSYVIEKICAVYSKVYIVGFSIGADIILEACKQELLDKEKYYILALDPNINKDTCFISNKIASLENFSDLDNLIKDITSNFSSIEEWVNNSQYLIKIITKFQPERLPYLIDFAKKVIERFKDESFDNFIVKTRNIQKNQYRFLVLFSKETKSILKRSMASGKIDTKKLPIEFTSYNHFELRDNLNVIREEILKISKNI